MNPAEPRFPSPLALSSSPFIERNGLPCVQPIPLLRMRPADNRFMSCAAQIHRTPKEPHTSFPLNHTADPRSCARFFTTRCTLALASSRRLFRCGPAAPTLMLLELPPHARGSFAQRRTRARRGTSVQRRTRAPRHLRARRGTSAQWRSRAPRHPCAPAHPRARARGTAVHRAPRGTSGPRPRDGRPARQSRRAGGVHPFLGGRLPVRRGVQRRELGSPQRFIFPHWGGSTDDGLGHSTQKTDIGHERTS